MSERRCFWLRIFDHRLEACGGVTASREMGRVKGTCDTRAKQRGGCDGEGKERWVVESIQHSACDVRVLPSHPLGPLPPSRIDQWLLTSWESPYC